MIGWQAIYKLFVVIMDNLIKGYYLTTLAESSRHFTAFITLAGMYEWLRVIMGLEGTSDYFQRIMATVIGIRLIH